MTVVLQHCFGSPGHGGPATALVRFLATTSQDYPVVWQRRPAGGISLSLIREMAREMKSLSPKLIHIRGLGNEGFHAVVAARLAGVPQILVSVHGTHRDLHNANWMKRFVVSKVLEPLTLMLSSAHATVSEFTAQRDFLKPFSDKRLPSVPNGVLLPDLSRNGHTPVRKGLGIPDSACVLVAVSRLSLEKGYSDLADALRMLPEYEPRPHLIVVGSGPDELKIKSLFNNVISAELHFVGYQSDVEKYLAASDIFVFPSWHENLSNALLEAMAHALPVVATSVGGNVEVLEKGGGMLVPPKSPSDFGAALRKLIEDRSLREVLSKEARKTIESNYSIENMVRGWETIYQMLLGGENER